MKPHLAEEAPAGAIRRSTVRVHRQGEVASRPDLLAVEEPMEIRVVPEVAGRRRRHSVAVTMRTPGHDFELAVGFLLGEGLVEGRPQVQHVAYCDDTPTPARNVVEVVLAPSVEFDPERFSRNVYTTSSCGVCGKTSIDLVHAVSPRPPVGRARYPEDVLRGLPKRLRDSQPVFSRTGGLHAAGLFDARGDLLLLREDVGRHNAVDKVTGTLLLEDRLPASDRLLLVSGRASFELVQKGLAAGIPALAAVGAPSSLAVELARETGLTLIGFLSEERFNVYTGEERVA